MNVIHYANRHDSARSGGRRDRKTKQLHVDSIPIDRRFDGKTRRIEREIVTLFTCLRPRPARFHCGSYSAARAEDATDYRGLGPGGADYVFEHAVHDVFLEDAQVAIVREVFLYRLQFQAELIGNVADL
jgi:hypothetical protein